MRARGMGVVVLLVTLGSSALAQGAARDSVRAPMDSVDGGATRTWLVGASIGVPGYDRRAYPELLTVGMHVTRIKPGQLGADFAIGTVPRAVSYGAAVVGLRAGLALPIAPAPAVLILPSAGFSFLGGAGGEGVVAARGWNAGIAGIVWTGPVGLRAGVTWHRFGDADGSIWLAEFGFMQSPGGSHARVH